MGKVLGNQRKTCSPKDLVLSLVSEYKVSTLYSGTGTELEFWRSVLRKRCVRIGAKLRIVPGHRARVPNVKIFEALFFLALYPQFRKSEHVVDFLNMNTFSDFYLVFEHSTILCQYPNPSARAPRVNTAVVSVSLTPFTPI